MSAGSPPPEALAGEGAPARREPGCLVCQKLAGEGPLADAPLVYEDELLVVSHPADEDVRTYLGLLVVETRRHVPSLAELTEAEAARIGVLETRLARALLAEGAEHVYSFVFDHVPHHHVELTARYPGTPRELWGRAASFWPGAPHGERHEVVSFCERLSARLA